MSDIDIFSISFKRQSKTLPKHELVRFPGEKPGKTQQEFGFSLSGLLLLLVRAHSLESIRTQFWSHLHHTCTWVQQGHGHTFVAFQINFKPIWFCNKRDAMEKCRCQEDHGRDLGNIISLMRKLNLPKGIDPKATLSTRVMSPLLFCYPSLVGVGEGFAISRGWDLCGSTLPASRKNIFRLEGEH